MKNRILPPSPISDRLISRYPPAQYKTIDGAPGIEDGAEVSKQVYDKYDEIYKIYQLLNAAKL